jgi:RNA polymerase sigma-70 factor, ECF subfamily
MRMATTHDACGEDERDEAELIAAAQADRAAFAALYRRYLDRIYRYLRAHCASADDAADLTQQVFLRALDALPRYHPGPAPFAAWLFRIAANAAVDAGRRRRPEIAWEALPPLPAAPESEPEAHALRRESLGRLRRLVAGLDAEKRELLALRFAGQLSSTEIAAVVGKRPEAVKKQLTRILRTLKEQYDEAE